MKTFTLKSLQIQNKKNGIVDEIVEIPFSIYTRGLNGKQNEEIIYKMQKLLAGQKQGKTKDEIISEFITKRFVNKSDFNKIIELYRDYENIEPEFGHSEKADYMIEYANKNTKY